MPLYGGGGGVSTGGHQYSQPFKDDFTQALNKLAGLSNRLPQFNLDPRQIYSGAKSSLMDDFVKNLLPQMNAQFATSGMGIGSAPYRESLGQVSEEMTKNLSQLFGQSSIQSAQHNLGVAQAQAGIQGQIAQLTQGLLDYMNPQQKLDFTRKMMQIQNENSQQGTGTGYMDMIKQLVQAQRMLGPVNTVQGPQPTGQPGWRASGGGMGGGPKGSRWANPGKAPFSGSAGLAGGGRTGNGDGGGMEQTAEDYLGMDGGMDQPIFPGSEYSPEYLQKWGQPQKKKYGEFIDFSGRGGMGSIASRPTLLNPFLMYGSR